MMKRVIPILILGGLLIAQPRSARPKGPQKGHPGQRLEMMKMWRLTEELNLSEEQASKFFPRYNALEKEIMDISKQQKELLKGLRERAKSDQEISQSELDEITKKVSDLEQQKIQKKQQFFEDLDDFLSTDQRAHYLGFELRFKEDLRKGMRDRMKGPPGGKGRGKKMKRMKKGGRW